MRGRNETVNKEHKHERRTTSKLRETAHKFCSKWRQICQENKSLNSTSTSGKNLEGRFNTQVLWNKLHLEVADSKCLVHCYPMQSCLRVESKTFKRMGPPVVEKQIIDGNIHEIIKEA